MSKKGSEKKKKKYKPDFDFSDLNLDGLTWEQALERIAQFEVKKEKKRRTPKKKD